MNEIKKTTYEKTGSFLGFERVIIRAVDLSDYLVRVRIPLPFGCCIYLHKILQSDNDRFLHDHPWNFVSFLVKGRYTEELPDGTKRLVSWINWHRATDAHGVRLFRKAGRELPVYTILFRGRRLRTWGFHTESGWIDWKTYNKTRLNREHS